jgi:DNA-binding CsgD family transcriptional regulator
MTWEGLAGQIAKANPGISPAVLARAVSMAQPWLTAQATQDWRAIEADIQRERNRIMEEGIRQRPEIAQIGATSRETVVGMRPEVRAFQDYLAKNPDASPQDQAKFIQSTKGSGAKSATATMAQKWWDEHPEGTVEDFQRFMEEPKDTRQRRTIESREGIAARGLTERAREFDTAETRRVETETARAEIARKRLEANRPTPEDKHVLADMLAHYRMGPENLGRGQYRAEVLAEASEIARKEGYVYDQSNWRAHQGTISAFTYGKQGQQMRSIAAVDAHLGSMEGLIPLLQNNDARSLNAIKNWISANVQGAPEVTNFNMARQIVANELGKALAQSGGGALADRLAYEVRFDVNSSPPQLGGAIKTARKLMRGQIDSFRGEYNSAAPGMMDSFDKRFPWLGNIGGAAKKAPAAKPAEKPATESKWGPVIIEGPGAEEQSKAAPTTPGGRAPPAGGPEFKDRFEGGGEGASPFDESTRRGPGLDAFYAIAARHGAEGEKIKSTAVDVLKHPQEYIQPGPGEVGMATPKYLGPSPTLLRKLVAEGKTLGQIGEQFGVKAASVWRWLKLHEIPANPSGRKPIDMDRAQAMLDAGKSYDEIGKALGVNPRSVRNLFPKGLSKNAPDWFLDEMKK